MNKSTREPEFNFYCRVRGINIFKRGYAYVVDDTVHPQVGANIIVYMLKEGLLDYPFMFLPFLVNE